MRQTGNDKGSSSGISGGKAQMPEDDDEEYTEEQYTTDN
jgi:hypothetical protein